MDNNNNYSRSERNIEDTFDEPTTPPLPDLGNDMDLLDDADDAIFRKKSVNAFYLFFIIYLFNF